MADYTPVRIAYNKHEPDSGEAGNLTPVIFLHGMIASKENWEDIPQIVANKTKRKVYVLDARNHGDSEWTDEFSFDRNADDLLHFMETVGMKKAILVGHSMGGHTAMKVALRAPEKIEGIVVEDMNVRKIPPEMLSNMPTFLKLYLKVAQEIPPELEEKEAIEFAHDFCLKNIPEEMFEAFDKAGVKEGPQFLFNFRRNSDGRYVNKTNFEALLNAVEKNNFQTELEGKYEGPVHFIFGGNSFAKVSEDADHVKKFFPNFKYTGIANVGHMIHTDARDEFMEALLKCLC